MEYNFRIRVVISGRDSEKVDRRGIDTIFKSGVD